MRIAYHTPYVGGYVGLYVGGTKCSWYFIVPVPYTVTRCVSKIVYMNARTLKRVLRPLLFECDDERDDEEGYRKEKSLHGR